MHQFHFHWDASSYYREVESIAFFEPPLQDQNAFPILHDLYAPCALDMNQPGASQSKALSAAPWAQKTPCRKKVLPFSEENFR